MALVRCLTVAHKVAITDEVQRACEKQINAEHFYIFSFLKEALTLLFLVVYVNKNKWRCFVLS